MASLATGVEVNRTPFTIFFEQTAASAADTVYDGVNQTCTVTAYELRQSNTPKCSKCIIIDYKTTVFCF